MFDVDGGFYNILVALINMAAVMLFVIFPVMNSIGDQEKSGVRQVIIGVIGLSIYCFLLYVANPSLTFWIVE
jgi:hypothetical protein